jgi:hypothetical protein
MGILLGWQNLLEQAGVVLGASSEAPGLGIRSVLTPQIAEIWRSGTWGATTIDIDADLGAVQPINVVAVAAPRDGVLPSAAATVALQASASAPPSRTNLQTNPSTIVPGGGTYITDANTTNLGAVDGPTGGTGARRLGSASATGANVWIARATHLPVVGGMPYRLSVWCRSNAAAPTRGGMLDADEYTGTTFFRRTWGPAMPNAVDGTWRFFSRVLTLHPNTTNLQVYFASGFGTGAEIEVADISIVRLAESIEIGAQALGLTPYGLWGWCAAAPASARYLRLSFTGSAADAYLQLGRLWAGPAMITTRAAALGHSLSAIDPGSSVRVGVSGLRVAQPGTTYRAQQFSAPLLTTAEATELQKAALAVGSTGQFIAARHHLDLAGTAIFGSFAGTLPSIQRIAPSLWRAEFSIEEDL